MSGPPGSVATGMRTFVKPDGATLSYEVVEPQSPAGEAISTLVCHPGGPGMSAGCFGDLAGTGSGRIRLVLFNPRGTGASTPPVDGRYELEDYASDLEALRGHLGLERLDLLGHSHGGFVGMVYALSHPERLRRLVLLCTAPRFSPQLREEAEQALAAHSGQAWFEDAVAAQRQRQAGGFETPAQLAALYAREVRLWFANDAAAEELAAALRREVPDQEALGYFNTHLAPTYDMRPRLPEIRVPTLILNGAADFFGPLVSARELSAIPGSKAVVMPGAGHFPFLDAPEDFRRELEAFLLA